MGKKRQKIQLELAFMAEGRAEPPKAAIEGIELSMAKRRPESPALPDLLMEEVCWRENLLKALPQSCLELHVAQIMFRHAGPCKVDRPAFCLINRTAVVRTRMPGGVTGKARKSLPVSITLSNGSVEKPVFESSRSKRGNLNV